MRRFFPLLALVLFGCGGNSGSGNDASSASDGSYTGTYVNRDASASPVSGTLRITVLNGAVSGTSTDSRYPDAGTVDPGSRLLGGSLSIAFVYGPTTATFIGRLYKGAGGVLSGTAQERIGASTVFYTFTLTPQLPGG